MPELTKEKFYKESGKTYDKNDPEAIIRYKNVMKWIKMDCEELQIYEIGCKFGELRKMLINTKENIGYKAVDIDEGTLKKIEGYNPDEFICSNVNEGIPFDDKTADYIICLEVMEHLENATFFIKELKRVLKDDGKLIISVPNPYCWSELFGNMLKKNDTQGHIATFTYQNIVALLKFSGLKLYDKTGSFTRIPMSRRLFGKPFIVSTNFFFFTRNNMYLIGP